MIRAGSITNSPNKFGGGRLSKDCLDGHVFVGVDVHLTLEKTEH